jgi:ribonuclease T1
MLTISHNQLPVEAHKTLKDIDQGGPFLYTKDGVIFRNREGKLPAKQLGYYYEYTVETPSANDRGPKRIIIGKGGEKYYTDDHYQSFKEIIK